MEEKIKKLITDYYLKDAINCLNYSGFETLGDFVDNMNKAQELGIALFELKETGQTSFNIDAYIIEN